MFEKESFPANPETEAPAAEKGNPGEKEELGEYAVTPEGVIITRKAAEEEVQRRAEDPNWFREQR